MTQFGGVIGVGPGGVVTRGGTGVITGTSIDNVTDAVNAGEVSSDTPGLQLFSDSWTVLVDFLGRYTDQRVQNIATIGDIIASTTKGQ